MIIRVKGKYDHTFLYLQAKSMRMADDVMLEGDVLQQPTIPVVNETNMKKNATMKSAIIARPMSVTRGKPSVACSI